MRACLQMKYMGPTLLALLALSGCSLAPAYVRPEPPVPASIAQESSAPDVTALAAGVEAPSPTPPPDQPLAQAPRIGWRDFFQDARLKELIALSLQNNRDVKLAALAMAEARAQYRVQNAERLPQLEADGSGTSSGNFRGGYPTEQYSVAAALPAFELDFFGRLASLSDAATQRYLASVEGERAARIALVGQVAQAYLAERLAQELLQLAQRTLESRRSSYAFIEGRVRSGQASLLDMEQARSQVEFAAIGVAQRQRELTQAGNALRLLLGAFNAQPQAQGASLKDQTFASLPAAVASTVLLERPDVLQAEHNLRAANADIGAARAAFFPRISLTGDLGFGSDDLQTLFVGGNPFWSFVPRIVLPIFSGGRNKANLDLAEVRKESSVLQYEKALQTAFREVADALQTRAALARQVEAQRVYLESQQLVQELATQRYVSGAISYLEVLDAQRTVFQAEQDLLNIRRDQLVNDITLYSALGGGLAETSTPDIPSAPVPSNP